MKNAEQDIVCQLEEWFTAKKKVAVAFSGGVDSSLLLFVGNRVLGSNCFGIIANSLLISRHQLEVARTFAHSYQLQLEERDFSPLNLPGFSDNKKDRCYICKKALYGDLQGSLAPGWYLVDGSNLDDNLEERPGFQAIKELAVQTPYLDLKIGKRQIREVSRSLGLSSWDIPSDSCLATRLAKNNSITEAGVHQVEAAEIVLRELGFDGVRASPYNDKILLTFKEGDLQQALQSDVRKNIQKKMAELSFSKVFLDLSERPGILP